MVREDEESAEKRGHRAKKKMKKCTVSVERETRKYPQPPDAR
jgi:hypothetical protein